MSRTRSSTDPTNGIIWQFHGRGQEGSPTIGPGSGDSPPLGANVRAGEDSISIFVKYDSISPLQDGEMKIFQVPLVRNQWNRWVLQVRFDYLDGFVNVWIDGVQKTNYAGPTIYHAINQNNETGPYLKIGIYKSKWGENPGTGQASNLSLYYDNVKIGNDYSNYNEVYN